MRISQRILTIVVGVAVLSVSASADQVTLIAIQDTYAQSIYPDTNFGYSEDMLLGKGTYWDLGYVRGLVEFDLSSLPSDPDLINSAVFSAYQYDTAPAAGGLPVDVKRITSEWYEDGVTWNKQPTYDDYTVWASADVGDSFHTGWINWGVTNLVKDQVGGDSEHLGWMLKSYHEYPSGASRLGYFHTTDYEANPSLHPKLVVDYVPEPSSLLLLGLAGIALRRR